MKMLNQWLAPKEKKDNKQTTTYVRVRKGERLDK